MNAGSGLRLTIARKIAIAITAIAILCVGTMAWVTSSNLKRGFIAYLNDMQAQDLDELSGLLAQRYRQEGNFDWLDRQPRALREVLDQMQPEIQTDFEPQRRRPRPPPRDGAPDDRRPRGPEGRDGPPGARDPMGFAARISIKDAEGRVLMGPPDFPPGIDRPVLVDGRTVATVRLRPLRQAAGANASASGFLREQVRDILILAGLLVLTSILLAVWLARHLLRPVAALRSVTASLARGQFSARAPVLSRDELAELALHVNAMAEALEANESQRRKMLADIAHELRTPLTVIRGEIEALIDGIREAGPAALESLHGEVLRLNKLVDDLHQLSLADAGDLHFDWQVVELGSLIAALAERYRPRAQAAGLSLRWLAPGAPVRVRADSGRLTQVFLNLFENSLRYTDAGGEMAAMLTSDGGQAVFTLDDSAPGVPDGAHASIFARLYKVDAARTRASGGSGLGLSICKALVEAHGGTITALPSPLGGVRMRVCLPLAQGGE